MKEINDEPILQPIRIENSYLAKKTRRREFNDFEIVGDIVSKGPLINYRAEDNVDIFKKNEYKNKLNYDILNMPDIYNYRENLRVVKPVIFNDGQTLSFVVSSDVFVDSDYFMLNLLVSNENKNNYLQKDCSLIKQIEISNNGELLERITDYHLIEDFMNDLTYTSNFYEDNTLKGTSDLTVDTKGIVIPPRFTGSNLIFNPNQIEFDYANVHQVENGKVSFKTSNTRLLSLKINSMILGIYLIMSLLGRIGRHHTKIAETIEGVAANLVPMFLFSCLTINIELNPYAFFVPVFNASVQDLTNTNINDEEYEYSRLLKEQKDITKRVFTYIPRTNTHLSNSKLITSLNLGDKFDRIFNLASLFLFKNELNGNQIKNLVISYFESHEDETSHIILVTNKYVQINDQQKFIANDTNIKQKILYESMFGLYISTLKSNEASTHIATLSPLPLLWAISEIYQIPIEYYIARYNDTTTNLTRINFDVMVNGNYGGLPIRIARAIKENDPEETKKFNFYLVADKSLEDKNKYNEAQIFMTSSDIFNLERFKTQTFLKTIFDTKESLQSILSREFFRAVKEISPSQGFEFLKSLDEPMNLFSDFASADEFNKYLVEENWDNLAMMLNFDAIISNPFYSSPILDVTYPTFVNFFIRSLKDDNGIDIDILLKQTNFDVKQISQEIAKITKVDNADFPEFSDKNEFTNYVNDNKNNFKFNFQPNQSYPNLRILNQGINKILIETVDANLIKSKMMNPQFLIKLIQNYGASQAYNILQLVIPDLFNYNKDSVTIKGFFEDIEKAEVQFNYSKLFALISYNFVSKFRTSTDLINYNPFLKYNYLFEQYKKSLNTDTIRSKLEVLSESLKNISFDLKIYDNMGMLPLIGLFGKLIGIVKSDRSNVNANNSGSILKAYAFHNFKNLLMLDLRGQSTQIEDEDLDKKQLYNDYIEKKINWSKQIKHTLTEKQVESSALMSSLATSASLILASSIGTALLVGGVVFGSGLWAASKYNEYIGVKDIAQDKDETELKFLKEEEFSDLYFNDYFILPRSMMNINFITKKQQNDLERKDIRAHFTRISLIFTEGINEQQAFLNKTIDSIPKYTNESFAVYINNTKFKETLDILSNDLEKLEANHLKLKSDNGLSANKILETLETKYNQSLADDKEINDIDNLLISNEFIFTKFNGYNGESIKTFIENIFKSLKDIFNKKKAKELAQTEYNASNLEKNMIKIYMNNLNKILKDLNPDITITGFFTQFDLIASKSHDELMNKVTAKVDAAKKITESKIAIFSKLIMWCGKASLEDASKQHFTKLNEVCEVAILDSLIYKSRDLKQKCIEGDIIFNLKTHLEATDFHHTKRYFNSNGIIYELLDEYSKLKEWDTKSLIYFKKYSRKVEITEQEKREIKKPFVEAIKKNLKYIFENKTGFEIPSVETFKTPSFDSMYTYIANIYSATFLNILNNEDLNGNTGFDESIVKVLSIPYTILMLKSIESFKHEFVYKIFEPLKEITVTSEIRLRFFNYLISVVKIIDTFDSEIKNKENIIKLFTQKGDVEWENEGIKWLFEFVLGIWEAIDSEMANAFELNLESEGLMKVYTENTSEIFNESAISGISEADLNTTLLKVLVSDKMKQVNNDTLYYNKPCIPDSNEIYILKNYKNTNAYEYIELSELPKTQYKSTSSVFGKISVIGILDEKNSQAFSDGKKLSKDEEEKLEAYSDYTNIVLERANDIFKEFYALEFKNEFSIKIFDAFRNIIKFLKNNLKANSLNKLIMVNVLELFISIGLNLIETGKISLVDVQILSNLPSNINELIDLYNSKKTNEEDKIRDVNEIIRKMEDPLLFEEVLDNLEKELGKKYQVPNFVNQKLFSLNNDELNLNEDKSLSRNYQFQAELVFKEIRFDNDNVAKEAILKHPTYKVKGSQFEVYQKINFWNTIPPSIDLDFYDAKIKNVYILIMNNAYSKYPTYRFSQRFSRKLKVFGAEINGVNYPPYLVSGNASNSNQNEQFIENLESAINIKDTSINKYNFALDTSTSWYVTKKIYGSKENLFEFSDNIYLDFKFGYNNEILGKSVQVINLEKVKALLSGKIPLDVLNMKLVFDNEHQVESDEDFSQYELIIITEKDYNFKI